MAVHSVEQYRLLLESSPHPMWAVDPETLSFLAVNEMAVRHYGFSRDEFLAMSIEDIRAPEDDPAVDGIPYGGDIESIRRHKKKDGSVIYVEMFSHNIPLNGTHAKFVQAKDITGWKLAEEELRHRIDMEKLIASISSHFINLPSDEIDRGMNHTLRTIGEFSRVDRCYVFMFYDNGTKMENTHEWCEKGIEPWIQNLKELQVNDFPWFADGIKKLETFHVPSVEGLPDEACAEKEFLQMQDIKSLLIVPMVNGKTPSGFIGFDSVRKAKMWKEEDIRLLKMVAEIFTNVLERRRMEETLRESEERYRSLVENIDLGITLIDTDYRIVMTNVAQSKLLKKSASEFAGNECFREFEKGDKVCDCCPGEQAMRTGKPSVIEKEGFYSDGSCLPVRIHAFPVFKTDGKASGFIEVVEDISRRKEAEAMQRERARAEIFAILVSALPVFLYGAPSYVKDTMVSTFAERFEKQMRPGFEYEMERLGYPPALRGKAGPEKVGKVFVSWLSGIFFNLGIRTGKTGTGIELLECPWIRETRDNSIFCIVCRTMVVRSFMWTSIKGCPVQKSSIAGGSNKCRFDIYFSP